MSDRQLRVSGLFVVALLMTAALVGVAWRAAAPSPASAGAGSHDLVSVEQARSVDRVRHIEVPPGWRAEQIAQSLRSSGIGNGGRFLRLVRKRGLEGFLYPGIYDVGPDFSERGLIAEMTARSEEAFSPTMRRRARVLGRSVADVVTLASIVQREMVYASEAPVIAAVYLNRLRHGMRLSADPTVIYALDSDDPGKRYWDRRLSFADLRVVSAYNTYRHRGLPPGPIANPTREAINAVLYPADVDYLFFVARGDGTHAFSETGAEHLELVRRVGEGRLQTHPDTVLQVLVERLMTTVPAHVGVVVKNLATGESAALNAGEFFTSASLYKLAVMLTAFQRRADGRLSFGQRVTISPKSAAEDGPAILARLGSTPTVRRTIEQMIVVSSNAAGVTLLHKFGRSSIDRLLRRYGLRDTSLSSLRIVTTPRDIAHLLELIATGRAVSPQASRNMRDTMLRQEINDRLPKYLPESVRLAHKTGTLDYPSHDAGILYTRNGPVVIVAMTEDATKRAAATEALARLGRAVYDYFDAYAPTARRLAVDSEAPCPASPFRAPARGPLSGKTIMVDPGQGGPHAGATFRFRDGFVLREKDVNLDVALRLKDALVARGATVHMTRCRDVGLTPIARAALTNAARPHLSVSLHMGRSGRPSKDGTAVYYFLSDGRRLANYLLGRFTRPALWETLSRGWPLPNEGLSRRPAPSSLQPTSASSFGELVYSLTPTAWTESVYLTNPAEAAALRAPDGRRRAAIARGHLQGILNYFDVKRPQAVSPRPRAKSVLRRPPARGVFRIAAAGDIALGSALSGEGLRNVFARVAPYLRGDVVLGNLESALTLTGPSKCAGKPSSDCFAFRSPPAYGRALRKAGFTVLNVANNHHRDYGLEGIAETLGALDRAHIAHTGRAGQITRLTIGRIRVAIVGFAPYPWAQSLLDLGAAARLVRRADAWADVVIVTMHAGAEGADAAHTSPGPELYLGELRGDPMRFAHTVIDAGADLVVGHGPHVLRGMEWYRGRLIAYSLGNFVGGDTFALTGSLSQGGILRVTLGADGSWRRGRLVGVRLTGHGAPAPEVAPAARVVDSLSGTDFGPAAVAVSARGTLTPPKIRVDDPSGKLLQGARPSPQAQRTALSRVIQLGSTVSCGGGRGRYVALTFDDGPSAHTADLLRVLRREGARATFFPVAERLARWPAAAREAARLGAVGTHGWAHENIARMSFSEAATELDWAQRITSEHTRLPVTLFRPAYGAHDATVDGLTQSKGMVETLWSIDGLDWTPGSTPRSIVGRVMSQLRPGAIVLLHDTYPRTLEAVRILLPMLRQRGYSAVTVPELLALDPPFLSQGRYGNRGWRCLGQPPAESARAGLSLLHP